MSTACWFVIALLASVPLAFPQQPVPKRKAPRVTAKRQGDTMGFLWAEMTYPGVVVKGKPFSAEAVTETSQTLGDGNRISHRTTARIYRDREGRTRRDIQLAALGPWSAATSRPMELSFLQDPVAGVGYTLNAHTRTAHKYLLQGGATAGNGPSADRTASQRPPGKPAYEFSRESLGRRLIEGVEATGNRTRMTIPAGQAGNERPIEASYERWYSPDLRVVVMSRYVDPRFGESVYHLTNLRREEPAPSLFLVPSDNVVTEKPLADTPQRPKQPPKGDLR
jgi:hypothetical protein